MSTYRQVRVLIMPSRSRPGEAMLAVTAISTSRGHRSERLLLNTPVATLPDMSDLKGILLATAEAARKAADRL